jgi:hypothetical protein
MPLKNTSALLASILILACTGPVAATAHAQTPGPGAGDGVRFGVSMGGVSTVGFTLEFYRNARSIDVTLGTWSFRDASLSATVRQYIGAAAARPVVGLGFWLVGARPVQQERVGWALALRAPVGLDWEFSGSHATGVFVNVNRGVWVRRSDPQDRLPLNRRLVPLPELYYRFAR